MLPESVFRSACLTRVQVHLCRGWVFAHWLCSGDWHRPLPLYGNKSGWISAQESGSASIRLVVNMHMQDARLEWKHHNCFMIVSSSFSASFHRWWSHQSHSNGQRADHSVLWGDRHPQTHCHLEKKRSPYKYWPEPEYIQVDPGFLPLFPNGRS